MEDYGIVFIVWLNLPQKLLAMSFQRLRRPEFFRCGQGSRLLVEDTLEGGSMELGIFSNLSGGPAIRLYFAYKIPHPLIPFLEGQLEFLAPSCADKLSLFFLVGAFAGHCSFQGCCSCSSTDMRHKANDSLLVLRINRTGSNRSRCG